MVFVNTTIHYKLFDIAYITFLIFAKGYTGDNSRLMKF